MTKKPTGKHAIVIGGSLAACLPEFCCARLLDKYLRTLWRSTISAVLCFNLMLLKHFNARAFLITRVVARVRYYLNPDGSIAQPMPMRQILSSWNLLYGSMRHFPTKHYHSGKHFSIQVNKLQQSLLTKLVTRQIYWSVPMDHDRATTLPAGCPLSLCRICRLSGLVNETELEDAAALFTERFVFYHPTRTFSNMWSLVSMNLWCLERRFNWVWYVNYNQTTELLRILTDQENKRRDYSVPPGMLAPAVEQEMIICRYGTCPRSRLVAATQEPFVQAILDLGVPQMTFDG